VIIYYKKTKIYYEIYGESHKAVVFLHGWGGNCESFKFVKEKLESNIKTVFIDFPPFGKSDEPAEIFSMQDYVNICIKIFEINNIQKPILIGHSFGGRVAIMLASLGYASKLILVNSAGIKPKFNLKKYLKIKTYKLLKKIGCTVKSGSKDYLQLSSNMKKTFVNIVNTFLEKYAILIVIPTIIYWGKKDRETPLYMAKKLNKLIKNSELVVLDNAGHFSYLFNVNHFTKTINSFIFD